MLPFPEMCCATQWDANVWLEGAFLYSLSESCGRYVLAVSLEQPDSVIIDKIHRVLAVPEFPLVSSKRYPSRWEM